MQSDFQKRAEDLYQAGVADGFRSGFVDVIKQALEEAAMSAAEPNLRHTLRTVEMSAERIRLTLINQLEEPARSAFWEAVRIRDLIRASLSETFATAALSTDAEPFGWTSKHINDSEQHRLWGRKRENVAGYKGVVVQALYVEPPAPSVAVKEDQR